MFDLSQQPSPNSTLVHWTRLGSIRPLGLNDCWPLAQTTSQPWPSDRPTGCVRDRPIAVELSPVAFKALQNTSLRPPSDLACLPGEIHPSVQLQLEAPPNSCRLIPSGGPT